MKIHHPRDVVYFLDSLAKANIYESTNVDFTVDRIAQMSDVNHDLTEDKSLTKRLGIYTKRKKNFHINDVLEISGFAGKWQVVDHDNLLRNGVGSEIYDKEGMRYFYSFERLKSNFESVIEVTNSLLNSKVKKSFETVMGAFLADMNGVLTKSRIFVDIKQEMDSLFKRYQKEFSFPRIEYVHFPHNFRSFEGDKDYAKYVAKHNYIQPDTHVFLVVCELIFNRFLDFSKFHNSNFLFYNMDTRTSLSYPLFILFEKNRENNLQLPLEKQRIISANEIFSIFERFFSRDILDFIVGHYLTKESRDFIPILYGEIGRKEREKIVVGDVMKGNKLVLHCSNWQKIENFEKYINMILQPLKPTEKIETPYFDTINKMASEHHSSDFPFELKNSKNSPIISMNYNVIDKYSHTINGVKYIGSGNKLVVELANEQRARYLATKLLEPIKKEAESRYNTIILPGILEWKQEK